MRGDELFTQEAAKGGFARMHPRLASFLKGFLSRTKASNFHGSWVVNAHLPPYPSQAFDSFLAHMEGRRPDGICMATIAVTNRCMYKCSHCYNANRRQSEMPLSRLKELACELQELGVSVATLSGGESLLRKDLEEMAASFDSRSALRLDSSGFGLSWQRASGLKKAGVFSIGVSVDSLDEAEHDLRRGQSGAFKSALRALEVSSEAGLYPYAVSVPFKGFLEKERFFELLRLVQSHGGRELQILEPCAVGRLAGKDLDGMVDADATRRILELEALANLDESLPAVSSFASLESPEAFGCCAGTAQIYIDGSGELCPCNLVPLSFGNVMKEPLAKIVARMRRSFQRPMADCVCKRLARKIKPGSQAPLRPALSRKLAAEAIREDAPLPEFFKIASEACDEVGAEELKESYNKICDGYEKHWLSLARGPVESLVAKLAPLGSERVFEAACGTGFATRLLARLPEVRSLTAVDISEGMLSHAREALKSERSLPEGLELLRGDALAALQNAWSVDLVFSSWALGYIKPKPFFEAAYGALVPGGHLALAVHKLNSPKEPLEIFASLIAEDPSALAKKVFFEFPESPSDLEGMLSAAGFEAIEIEEGSLDFAFDFGREALEHLMLSGAGTAYYDAVDPAKREELKKRFVQIAGSRRGADGRCHVVHEYLSCVARRPKGSLFR